MASDSLQLNMSNSPTELDFYHSYSSHKGWNQAKSTASDVDRFTNIFRRLRVPEAGRILEIGFGEGLFLDWAKQRGHEVEGVEILPEMVEYVRTKGHVVHLGKIANSTFCSKPFHLLAAFDVIEHLTLDEIIELLRSAETLLQQGGQIVLQFPNAGSPFSAPYQSGDVTHRQALSKQLVEQIAEPNGWQVVECFNSRARSKHPLKQLGLIVIHLLRDWIELFLGLVYFGCRYPLDPNIVIVLERSRDAKTRAFPLAR